MMQQKGLYLITQNGQDFTNNNLANKLRDILQEGISYLQYRNKTQSGHRQQIEALKAILEPFDTPLIINDDPSLCVNFQCNGVHLGGDDGSINAARLMQEKKIIIGASCYNDINLASQAVNNGADYIAFGAMYPSDTKPLAIHCPIATLKKFTQTHPHTTMVAIGGITVENSPHILDAGAHHIAVISAVWDTPEPAQSVHNFNRIFKEFS